jgi:hypothetical protein
MQNITIQKLLSINKFADIDRLLEKRIINEDSSKFLDIDIEILENLQKKLNLENGYAFDFHDAEIFSNSVYDFIENNKNILNLVNYSKDTNIDMNIINEHQIKQECSIKYLNFIKKILENVKVFEYNEIMQILRNNIIYLNELITRENYIPILIMTSSALEKSNIYFSLLFLKYYETFFNKKIKYIFPGIRMLIDERGNRCFFDNNDHFLNQKLLFILCDDISYSGSQLSSHINPEKNNIFGDASLELDPKFIYNVFGNKDDAIFLNIIAYLKKAKDKIMRNFEGAEMQKKVIFGNNLKPLNINLKIILDKLANEEKKTIDKLIAENDLYILQYNSSKKIFCIKRVFYDEFQINFKKDDEDKKKNKIELSLIYPFFKFPDDLSTVQMLCRLENYKNNIYAIDMEKLKNNHNYHDIYDKIANNTSLELNINDILKSNEIQNLKTWRESEWEYDDDEEDSANRPEWLVKCKKNGNSKYIPILKTISSKHENLKITGRCNDYAIDSFYKSLKWNPEETIDIYSSLLSNILPIYDKRLLYTNNLKNELKFIIKEKKKEKIKQQNAGFSEKYIKYYLKNNH